MTTSKNCSDKKSKSYQNSKNKLMPSHFNNLKTNPVSKWLKFRATKSKFLSLAKINSMKLKTKFLS